MSGSSLASPIMRSVLKVDGLESGGPETCET